MKLTNKFALGLIFLLSLSYQVHASDSQDIMRNYRYIKSVSNSLELQAFESYVGQLDSDQKAKLKEKFREVKITMDQISLDLSDWYNRQDKDFQRTQLLQRAGK